MLQARHGKGLFCACRHKPDQYIGWYHGTPISKAQYFRLNEYTGLRHTLTIDGQYVNGLHGVTGAQFANTARPSDDRTHNAKLAKKGGTLKAKARTERGTEMLWSYKWDLSIWKEIESGIVGCCAWDEVPQHLEMATGYGGGQYIAELATAIEGAGMGGTEYPWRN